MTDDPNAPTEAPHVKTVMTLAAVMQRLAVLVGVPTAVVAVVVGLLVRGGSGAVGAALGALLALGIGYVGMWVMRSTAAASPAGVMIGAMASFAGKFVLLMIILIVFRGTTLFDIEAFGLALLAVTGGWIGGEVAGFVRARVPAVDV